MAVFYTYIVYDKKDSLQGIGVTIDLKRRLRLLNLILKSKDDYCKLVYYEEFADSTQATAHEDALNEYSEKALRALIEDNNPVLVDLVGKDE
jgi:predicted GIY-YIG superfamily endonuclease